MSADRFPIEVEDILAGDEIRWEHEGEPVAGELSAVEYTAKHDEHGQFRAGQHFLLSRREPDVSHFPSAADPRPGWVVLKDGTRIPGGSWFANRFDPRDGGPPAHSLFTHERDVTLDRVAGFVEAVLVETADVDALAEAHPPRLGRTLEPVDKFLRKVRGDR